MALAAPPAKAFVNNVIADFTMVFGQASLGESDEFRAGELVALLELI
jgi:hypothetical protein